MWPDTQKGGTGLCWAEMGGGWAWDGRGVYLGGWFRGTLGHA